MNSELVARVQREQTFHDKVAEQNWSERKLVNKLGHFYYTRDAKSCIWGPVWKKLNLRGATVLDYGCGPGWFTPELLGRGAIVTGIDISPNTIVIAREKYPATYFVGDCHFTKLPSNSFDYIFGNSIIHHLEIRLAYAEISRLLKPRGKAFFMEPMNDNPAVKLARKLTPQIRTVDETPLTEHDIKLAEQFGFTVKYTAHYLTSLVAAPLQLISEPLAGHVIRGMDRVDQALFAIVPKLKPYGWLIMLELEKL